MMKGKGVMGGLGGSSLLKFRLMEMRFMVMGDEWVAGW